MKTAFVFPGQGAQYVGMATDFMEKEPEFAAVLSNFDSVHGTELARIMAEGPEDLLKETKYTQPAILFHSLCALKIFQIRSGLRPDFVAGHSLGEFSALVANGTLDWSDALHLVHKRGEFMIEANAGVPFAMAAVIGLDAQTVLDICAEAEAADLVRAVNFNTLTQTVISGTESGVAKASELARAQGAKRVLPLVVGGPFHTPLIHQASEWLIREMKDIEFKDAEIPLVSNLDALPNTVGAVSREKLGLQIISPVLWVDCVRRMIDGGVGRFIEFGPQKVLGGMIKNIDKDVQIFNLDKLVDLDALLEALSAGQDTNEPE
ncbi:MAG TPA: ACP S-malonyltransferase [Candidatus Syntrophosphaera sp.]|nr:ACP S-malonyltransferase [Candidatus Syntrophosphaera sp.]